MVLASPELTMRTESRLMTVVDWMALAIFVAVLLLSARVLAADAGADAPIRAVGVAHGLLLLDDGRTVTVDGGVYLSDAVAIERVKYDARLEAENQALKQAPTPVAVPPLAFAVTVVVALAAGFVGGYLTPHP